MCSSVKRENRAELLKLCYLLVLREICVKHTSLYETRNPFCSHHFSPAVSISTLVATNMMCWGFVCVCVVCRFVYDPLSCSWLSFYTLKSGPGTVLLISLSGCYTELNKLFVCVASAGVSLDSQAVAVRLVCATVITNLAKVQWKQTVAVERKLRMMEEERESQGEREPVRRWSSFQRQCRAGNSFFRP